MTIQEVASLIGAITGIVSLLVTAFVMVSEVAAMKVKVDTLWAFLIRRGMVEAKERGMGDMNSPFIFNEETKKWIAGLTIGNDLRDFYHRLGRNLTDTELAFEIERNFGDRLLHEICIPKSVSLGACILVAMELIKNK